MIASPGIQIDTAPSVRVSSLALVVFAALLIVETLSGALRFYLDGVGLAPLIYVPKLAALFLAGALILSGPQRTIALGAGLPLGMSATLALVNGASLANIGFTIFVLAPFIFGFASARHLFRRQKELTLLACVALATSAVGAAADWSIGVPWKGYAYVVGEHTLVANRQWWAAGVDRVGGFARSSALLAMIVGVLSLYVNASLKSILLKAVVFFATLFVIAVTTNKSSLVGYVLAFIASGTLLRSFRPQYAMAVMVGLLLPAISIFIGYEDSVGRFDSVFRSLSDRLANTWPGFYALLDGPLAPLLGQGFGNVGSAVSVFPKADAPVNQWPSLAVADNGALYLWGMFGVFGCVLYSAQYLLLRSLQRSVVPYYQGLLSVVYFLVIVSWFTDVAESAVACLFLGLACGHVLCVGSNEERS